MRQALAEGGDVNAPFETTGWTALAWASLRGEVEVVDALLGAGADVNRPDEQELTPLLHAAGIEDWQYHARHLAVVKRLLAAGADAEEARAQLTVYERERTRRLQELPDVSAVFSIIQHGSNGLLREYITRGFDVNAEGYSGLIPLMYAAQHGNIEAARPLLHAGARADVTTALGHTALKNAALGRPDEIVRMVLEAGHRRRVEGRPRRAASLALPGRDLRGYFFRRRISASTP